MRVSIALLMPLLVAAAVSIGAAADTRARCRRVADNERAPQANKRQQNATADACNVYSDCFSCTSDDLCGWCPANCGGDRGCHLKTNHVEGDSTTKCAHPEDGWTPTYSSCIDPCESLVYCDKCLGFVQDSTTCGFCADGSGCQRGTSQGADADKHNSCSDWRWKEANSSPLSASQLLGLCTEKYSTDCSLDACFTCAQTFHNYTHKCTFCSEVGSGDGSCEMPGTPCGQRQATIDPKLCPKQVVPSGGNRLLQPGVVSLLAALTLGTATFKCFHF